MASKKGWKPEHKRRFRTDKPGVGAKGRISVQTCDTCGKQCYFTRRQAKAAGKILYPDLVTREYQCGDWWHVTTSYSAQKTAHYREYNSVRRQQDDDE